MNVVGKLIKKLPIESGVSKKGNNWQKLTFVLQIKGTKFPKQLALEAMNADVIKMVNDTSLETILNCEIDVTSREWNERWFTSATAWRVEVESNQGNIEFDADHKGVQQMAQMHNEQYKRATPVEQAVDDDDLPF